MTKTPFFAYSHKFYIKDKAMKSHWVVHSLMKPIDDDKIFNRRVIIRELGSSLNDDDSIDASVIPEVKT